MNKKKQILIVEDEPVTAMDIQRTLQNLGYEVSGVVASGTAAIQEVKQNHPDLVLMDIVLKGQMDGVEAASQMRLEHNIPIVYLTAHIEDMTLDRVITTEPFGYLSKPFKDKELKAAIEIALSLDKCQKELEASKDSFHNIVGKSNDSIIVVDENKTIKFFNPMAEVMLGLKSKQDIGETLALPVAVRETVDIEITCSNGGKGFGEMHTIKTEWQNRPAYLVSVIDITERRKIENEAKKYMHDLELFHKASVGRELKMIELKEQIADLEAELIKK